MQKPIVQIYEIQTPEEARDVIRLGVDHIGSVLTSDRQRRDPGIRATVSQVRRMGATSSLIPLFTETAAVIDAVAFHRPDIVHFCDRLDDGGGKAQQAAIDLQLAVRERFPDIRIMRSIPIGPTASPNRRAILDLAARLEPFCDYFLTDTVIGGAAGGDGDQPVAGFVGITGLTCDWSVAADLVVNSRIPVILAGGISPENVAEGILRVRPFGVDSCTATNAVDENGRPIRFKKDLGKTAAMVAAVHEVWTSISGNAHDAPGGR